MDILPLVPSPVRPSNGHLSAYLLLLLLLLILIWLSFINDHLAPSPSRHSASNAFTITAHVLPTHHQKLVLRPSSYGSSARLTPLQPVTAVLVVSSSPQNSSPPAEAIVQQLSNYPYIKELILWNNNLTTPLSVHDYQLLSASKLRIFNSPGDIPNDERSLGLSAHIACSLATYQTCYFNDQVRLNQNLDSLYTKYIDAGSCRITASSSRPHIQLHDKPQHIHTGSHLASPLHAVLSPRNFSSRFLRQISLSAMPGNTASFSVWANTPLESLVVHQTFDRRADEIKMDAVQSAHSLAALKRILSKADPTLTPEPFPLSYSSLSSPNFDSADKIDKRDEDEASAAGTTITVASPDDRVLLFTHNDNHTTSMEDADFQAGDLLKSLDGNLQTCSSPLRGVVGLRFVEPIPKLESFSVGTTPSKSNEPTQGWLVTRHWKLQVQTGDQVTQSWVTVGEGVGRVSIKGMDKTLVNKIRVLFGAGEGEGGVEVCGFVVNEDWII